MVDKKYLDELGRSELEERLSAAPVDVEVRQTIGADAADEILEFVRDVAADALIIGIRAPEPGREDDDGQCRPVADGSALPLWSPSSLRMPRGDALLSRSWQGPHGSTELQGERTLT